ncbi:MAG: FixH family protein [Pseudomonadota bacterium]
MSKNPAQKAPLRDRLIPWYFVMAFAVVMAVNGFFVFLAIKTNSGLVTSNAYQKGLHYNHIIKQAEQQERLGWQSQINYQDSTLRFILQDDQGQALSGAVVEAYISRPVQAGYESQLILNEQDKGIYTKTMDFALPGQWEITVNALWKKQFYQKTSRLIIR